MTTEPSAQAFGWRLYGLGVMTLGALCLIFGNFDPGQPVPKDFPERSFLAYAAGVVMLVAGAAVEWRRTAAWGAGALAVYYTLVVVLLMNGRVALAHSAEFGTYSGAAAQVAIGAGGLIVYAANAGIEARLAARLMRAAQLAFGICAVLFGGARIFLHEPYRPAGSKLAAVWPNVLGICDRSCAYRGRACDPDRHPGPPRCDPADHHVRVLHPAGAYPDAPGRAFQPLVLERKRRQHRRDRHGLGCG